MKVGVMVALIQGYNIGHTLTKNKIGGKTHTEYLLNLIQESNPHVKSSIMIDFIEELKEKFCFVDQTHHNNESTVSVQQHDFELPDSTVISLTNELSKCPELLFKNDPKDPENMPLTKMIQNSIKPMEVELKQVLLENIHLAGGNTLFEGFDDRLKSEIQDLKKKNRVQVVAPVERIYSTWIGGSILTCINSFNDSWILRQDYAEMGPNISYRNGYLF
jgi:actin-related protein